MKFKMMRILPVFFSAIVMLSCGTRSSKMEVSGESAPGLKLVEAVSYDQEEEAEADDQQQVNIAERKLIRNGNMNFKTKDVKNTKAEIEKICKELKAYISSETQNNYSNSWSYTQKIRVPATQFDELIQRIESLAVTVDNKSIDTQDVTEEFIDVESRLNTKKDLEKRYTELLNKATSVEDLLSIEKEMSNVRADIESMEGRLKYLSNQVSFSTLDVTYYEQGNYHQGFGSKLADSVKEGWENLVDFFIGLIRLWPFVIIAFSGGWWFIRYRRNKRAQASS